MNEDKLEIMATLARGVVIFVAILALMNWAFKPVVATSPGRFNLVHADSGYRHIDVVRDSLDGRCWAFTQSNGPAFFGPIPCE